MPVLLEVEVYEPFIMRSRNEAGKWITKFCNKRLGRRF